MKERGWSIVCLRVLDRCSARCSSCTLGYTPASINLDMIERKQIQEASICGPLCSSLPYACHPRPHGVVPEVWICCGPLATEDSRTCVWLCAVQSRMLQSVSRLGLNGWPRTEKIHNNCNESVWICTIWPRLVEVHKHRISRCSSLICPRLNEPTRLVCERFQGRIVGCAPCCCSKAGASNTMQHRTHTPTRHRSSRSFTTREDDGGHQRWLIRWTFCTGYSYLVWVKEKIQLY